ncbi:ferritin-like domain-containing protein [Pedobacter sp. UBA5917]|jgi:rubrerythrin|uniref:ferritin-like domain-containing protein n=1 Tax=Pedobacter sp. UBA5917 TaxID=1947061 RepID=UPI0025D652C7|nr:ferritin-like domain-containing protein [Pedobacter sp. UBA5917]
MNILNILEEIEKVDGEIYERLNPRRKAMQDFYNIGKKISLAALPLAMGSLFQKAYGQTPTSTVTDVLNFALGLEYLEWNFYNHALVATPSLVPDTNGAKTAITLIRDHERAHVNLLKSVLNITTPTDPASDGTKYADYQFEAVLADVFTNYQSFLKVGVALEDTGVRAYKGQAGILSQGGDLSKNAVLKTALQIHAVEARHAAHLRAMAAASLGVNLKPWIAYAANGNDTGIGLVDGNYAGEQNTTQAGVDITSLFTAANGSPVLTGAAAQTAAAECFDEALDGVSVKKLANAFIKSSSGKQFT